MHDAQVAVDQAAVVNGQPALITQAKQHEAANNQVAPGQAAANGSSDPANDSMIFSDKNSLDDYVIGK